MSALRFLAVVGALLALSGTAAARQATHHKRHSSRAHAKHRTAAHKKLRGPLKKRRGAKARVLRNHKRARAHIALGVPAIPVGPARITGTAYYVSPGGSDSAPGTSPAHAWRTVGRVNDAPLRPGDGVLFQGGATFADNTLMPAVSGTAGAPIVFGSYGAGQATITQGVWFIDHDYLTFDNLRLGPDSGLQGGNSSGQTANHIVVQRSTVSLRGPGDSNLGIYSSGNHWTIVDDRIQNVGNSGMLLNGDSYTISGNTIATTGLDRQISYGKHGIYLEVADAVVTNNTITNFSADGISARYRNSTIRGNHISGGSIGIAFFQYDSSRGVSHWTNNVITRTSDAGIYVSPSDQAGPTIESFVITGNRISTSGQRLNIHATRGSATVARNGG